MRRRRSVAFVAVSLLVPLLLVGVGATWFFASLRSVQSGATNGLVLTIAPGTGVRGITRLLTERGLIRSSIAFQLAVGLAGLTGDLKAGTYELSPDMSAPAIARALVRGPVVRDITLTIREGWTSSQIATYVEQRGLGTAADFRRAAAVHDSREILPDQRFDFLVGRSPEATLEGYLFPDTYRVYPEATPIHIIEKMLTNFGLRVSAQLQADLRSRAGTLAAGVTLASIVEREARTAADRKLVADIFLRRLAAGMPLQSDATINYVTGKQALQPTADDLAVASPYNTYRQPGLPPGPIDNPGLDSLEAVAHPTSNDALYFLTDAEGAVHYARTYDEHLANKRRYLP